MSRSPVTPSVTPPPPSSRIPGSFRDPGGFVFERDGTLFRQVNRSYDATFDRLVATGLDQDLMADGWLIPHREVDEPPHDPTLGEHVLQPERVPFVAYPYEWCFGQFRAAALRTLAIQRRAVGAGLSLKDASAFNIQFVGGQPLLIDSLSFEVYDERQPWVAYRQFCQHFLAPLALMAHADPRLAPYFRANLDGIPLDLTSRLLPARTWVRPRLLLHIHGHARSQRAYSDSSQQSQSTRRSGSFSRRAMLGLIESLEATVRGLTWNPVATEWADYYDQTNYTSAATDHKAELVGRLLAECRHGLVWDLGANTGRYSQIAARSGAEVVAFDVDPACVERHHRAVVARGEPRILPLLMDLANPSPALGWDHGERLSLLERGPADVALALALIHHLAIGNNLPLDRIAAFLARATHDLVIEFVPKSDSQVQRLLARRTDIFPGYCREGFEAAFRPYFRISRVEPIPGTERTLYLMRASGR